MKKRIKKKLEPIEFLMHVAKSVAAAMVEMQDYKTRMSKTTTRLIKGDLIGKINKTYNMPKIDPDDPFTTQIFNDR